MARLASKGFFNPQFPGANGLTNKYWLIVLLRVLKSNTRVFEWGVLELGVRLIYPNAPIAECKVNSLSHPLTIFPAYIYLHL